MLLRVADPRSAEGQASVSIGNGGMVGCDRGWAGMHYKLLLATKSQLAYFARTMKQPVSANVVREGQCAQPGVCPLSSVRSGTVVCIKELTASQDIMDRLREMGFCEEQRIKLLSRDGNYICQVCNARLGISAELAESILVTPLPGQLTVA
ncbi:MAG: hypothetical protein JWQ04_2376 [Pedosphaera sp.]|nr:hypothetical protein [Pedosphaera sp.]